MAGNTRDVNLRTRLKGSEKVAKGLGRVDKGLSRLAKSAIGTATAFLGARMLYEGMKAVINAAKEQELQERKLAAVIKSTGGAANMSAREFTHMASALQKQTRFGDEAIIQAQSLMLTFTKVGKEVMPDAIETVLNMSEAMGTDLRSTVIQVGKALNDPILGVTALRRVGVQLSDQQMQQVDDFMAVNDVAGAQKVILGELETQFGGLAKAAGEGLAGSLDKAKNAVGDAAEDIGTALAPAVIKASHWFSKAATSTSAFFTAMNETSLERSIRVMTSLGSETKALVILQTQAKINQLSAIIGAEDENKIKDRNITLLEEQNFHTGKIVGLQKAIAITDKDAMIMIANKDNANQSFSVNAIAFYEEQIALAEESALATQAEVDANQLVVDAINDRANATANLALLTQVDGTGDGKKTSEIELMVLTEAQKTQILADQAEVRKQIQLDEQIGDVPREAYQQGLELLGLSLKQKETMMSAFDKNRKKRDKEAHETRIKQNLESALLQGQSAKESALSVIKAETAEMQASLISSIMNALPFPINLAVAAGAGSMVGKLTDKLFSFPTGGSFVTKGRTTLPIGNGVTVGDNASGMERVDITPLPSPNQRSDGNITININAPLVDEFVVDSIIPAIQRAQKLNL